MPKKEPSRQFKVGDKICVNLHRGRIEEAVIRAVVERTDGTKYQVDVVGSLLLPTLRISALLKRQLNDQAALLGDSG
jgi:hypothetical protein